MFFICIFALAMIFFNWLVNPYNIYNPPHFKSFEIKPLVSTHLRLVKAISVQLKKPEYIVLGSSTAETGIDPNKLDLNTRNVYNLGLPSANIYEILRYLQHAQSIKPLKKVVLVVNFFMFNAYLENRVDFDESILKVDANDQKNQSSLNTLTSTLLSFDALKASIETIKGQNSENVYQSNGQLILNFRQQQVSKFKDYKKYIEYVESYNRETFFPSPKKKYSFIDSQNKINSMSILKKIIESCEKNNSELIIIIAPEHVRLLETYKILGLWSKYEEWQEKITSLINEHNKDYSNSPFKVWAFNKINYITTEYIPDSDDPTKTMQWFWDPFHFKAALGDLILENISLQKKLSLKNVISVILTKDNLQPELKKNRRLLLKWELNNSTVISELKKNLISKNP